MNQNTAQQPKYRISLTLPQINYLISLCEKDTIPDIDLIKVFKLLVFKATEGLTNPAFLSVPRVSLETKLELESLTLEEHRLRSYLKWQGNPAACSSQEIREAHMHRYLNDMMTEQEEQEYLEDLKAPNKLPENRRD